VRKCAEKKGLTVSLNVFENGGDVIEKRKLGRRRGYGEGGDAAPVRGVS